jgi:hypothetical protein
MPPVVAAAPVATPVMAYSAPVSVATVASSLVGRSVCFRTHQNKYLCAEKDGRLVADRDSPREWEHFSIHGVDAKDPRAVRVNIRSHHGKYLCSESDKAIVNRDAAREWELWTIVDLGNGTVAFRDYRGKYLCVEREHHIVVNRDKAAAWEALTPVIQGGGIEVKVSAAPSYSPAPSSGFGGGGLLAHHVAAAHHHKRFALRAHTHRYLCAEQDGRLVCDRSEAREWETFTVIPSSGGRVHIKSHHGKYLCSEGGRAICNRSEAREWEEWHLVDVGYNQVALKDHRGKFMCVESNGNIVVNRDHAREWETFHVVNK